ncbi:ceramidase domain-containing protein [Candidatus Desantisbacteria bacterium]|nr:ceramidase domain-containing protein [Candidatus Desantisbacteria bacterium]
MNRKSSILLIEVLSLIVFTVMIFIPRIPQDPAYHLFIDTRTFFGIPNFLNVITNLPFIIIGLAGSIILAKKISSSDSGEKRVNIAYFLFFFSIFLTGFGSGYYHLSPDNSTIVWDRLPMTMFFMALLSGIFYERMEIKGGLIFLFSLVAFGILTIIYWHFTELKGQGDLRPYIIVQFYSMILIPLLLWLFPSRYKRVNDIWILLLFYGIAKAFEVFDKQIFETLKLISGHSIKHIISAFFFFFLTNSNKLCFRFI